jgi:hypothetical protein
MILNDATHARIRPCVRAGARACDESHLPSRRPPARVAAGLRPYIYIYIYIYIYSGERAQGTHFSPDCGSRRCPGCPQSSRFALKSAFVSERMHAGQCDTLCTNRCGLPCRAAAHPSVGCCAKLAVTCPCARTLQASHMQIVGIFAVGEPAPLP